MKIYKVLQGRINANGSGDSSELANFDKEKDARNFFFNEVEDVRHQGIKFTKDIVGDNDWVFTLQVVDNEDEDFVEVLEEEIIINPANKHHYH